MREIQMSGTTKEELEKGIEFILSNQSYNEKVEKITHMKVLKNHIIGFDFSVEDGSINKHFDNEKYAKEYGKLPIPLNVIAFSSMASDWWKDQKAPDGFGGDGTDKKGFLLSYGKDWGCLDPDENGTYTDTSPSDDNNIIEFENIHSIYVIVNNQHYGK